MPVFEYEHIDDWASGGEHTAENIALLCPNHHSAKTTKKLDRERVREQRLRPFNSTRPTTAGYKVEGNRTVAVSIAGQHFGGELSPKGDPMHVLYANETSLLSIRDVDGWLALSFSITKRNGEVILQVVDGELTVSTSVWDYTYEGSRLMVRGAIRNILLDLTFSSDQLHVQTGYFFDQNDSGYFVVWDAIEFIRNGIPALSLRGQGGRMLDLDYALSIIDRSRFPNLSRDGVVGIACHG